MSTLVPAIRRMSSSSVRTTSAPRVGDGVAAVEKPVDGDGRHPVPDAELDAGEQVAVERVHAAGAEQAHEVQGAARVCRSLAQSSTRGRCW